jgi:drug/metabolite transporter (DMT)-like permease
MIGLMAASTAAIFIRFAQQYAPSLAIAALRLTFASLILAPIAITRRKAELSRLDRSQLRWGLLAGLFLALHFATWISSLEFTTVASSVVLVSTTPLWVALLSPLTIKEPLKRPMQIGMLLALMGVVIIGIDDACTWQAGGLSCPSLGEFLQGRAFLGDLLALAGALFAAGYLLIGRRLRSNLSALSYIFVVYGMAAILLVVLALFAGYNLFSYAPPLYLWTLLLALFPQLIGHTSINWALGFLSAALVSVAMLAEPIGSTALAYIIFQETPGAIKIFGAILILLGIYIAARGKD